MVLLAEDTRNGPEGHDGSRAVDVAVMEEAVRCGRWLNSEVMLDLMPNEQVVVTADRCYGAGDTARVSLRTERCVSRLASKRPAHHPQVWGLQPALQILPITEAQKPDQLALVLGDVTFLWGFGCWVATSILGAAHSVSSRGGCISVGRGALWRAWCWVPPAGALGKGPVKKKWLRSISG